MIEIIRSVKAFGRTDRAEKELTDIARLVDDTLTMARSEYKYVADIEKQVGGLAIARGIVVDRHQGEIRLESRQGMGTTFFVRLPIAEPVPAS